MFSKQKIGFSPDPRTTLFLLLAANIITFTQRSIVIEIGWFAAILFLMCLSGMWRAALKCGIAFAVCLLLQYILFPNGPKLLSICFSIIVSYARKMMSCLAVGVLLIKKTTIRELMQALRSMYIPQSLIIPLSVTIRYFPAIREELCHIKDALKLRNLHGIEKLEYYIVPVMLSATAAAEELSAAAVARGVENPCRKTSIEPLELRGADWCCMLVGIVFMVAAATVGRQ